MTRARHGVGVAWGALVPLAVVLLLVGGCAPSTPGASAPGGTASLAPALGGSPVAAGSPVEGLLVRLDSEGLTRVKGFRLRTTGGEELDFSIGVLENGAQFPPGHLAEHMSTSSRIRVFFRDAGGERVVYRLEDAE